MPLGPALLAPVIAHRGASGSAPENTVAALALAAEQGARCMEIDVAISRDGVAFVHHDDSLERCTNGRGRLSEQNADYLDELTADCDMPDFHGEPLPRLATVLAWLVERRLGLNLEIKPAAGLSVPTTEAICDEIETSWPADVPLVFSSFDRDALAHARDRLPGVARALLVGRIPGDWQAEIERLECRNIHCDGTEIEQAQLETLLAADLGVYCYTINDGGLADALWAAGAHGIFTDFPRSMLERHPPA